MRSILLPIGLPGCPLGENRGVLHSVVPGPLWTLGSPVPMDHFKPNSVWITIVLDDLSDGACLFFMGGPHLQKGGQLLVQFWGHMVKKLRKIHQEAVRSKIIEYYEYL